MKRSLILGLVMLVSAVWMPLSAGIASAAPICVQAHTVARGETMYRIARTYQLSVSALQTMNGLSNPNRINAGQVLCVRQQEQLKQYTVKRGDTLYRIARTHGINVYTLAELNGITNLNQIYAGQVLQVPNVTLQ